MSHYTHPRFQGIRVLYLCSAQTLMGYIYWFVFHISRHVLVNRGVYLLSRHAISIYYEVDLIVFHIVLLTVVFFGGWCLSWRAT